MYIILGYNLIIQYLYFNKKLKEMKKMKVIDLFGVKYDQMEDMINKHLDELQDNGSTIIDVKIMGQKLSQTAVFVYYEQ